MGSDTPLVTFIIPSTDRPTLTRTLQSLQNQSIQNWKAIVIFDMVPEATHIILDERIQYINVETKLGDGINGAGPVRNFGINLVTTPWIGFVDDDDSVTNDYIKVLTDYEQDQDILVFTMRYSDGRTLPPKEHTNKKHLQCCSVGISFAVRKEFLDKTNIQFPKGRMGDWGFLNRCLGVDDLRLKVLTNVTYNIGY